MPLRYTYLTQNCPDCDLRCVALQDFCAAQSFASLAMAAQVWFVLIGKNLLSQTISTNIRNLVEKTAEMLFSD